MEERERRRLLERLRDELDSAHAGDPEMKALSEETRRALAALPADRGEIYRSFRERLQRAVKQYGASHPKLTSTMAQVIDQLGMWGI